MNVAAPDLSPPTSGKWAVPCSPLLWVRRTVPAAVGGSDESGGGEGR